MFLKVWQDFVQRKTFSYFLVFLLVLAGFISLNALPKESTPEVQIPIAIVSTAFPGATAAEVEVQITNEVETAIDKLDGVDEVTSTSSDGLSTVVVNFKSGEIIDEKVTEVKDEVDKIQSKLPADSTDPVVSDVNFSDQPIFSFTIASDENKFALRKNAEDLKEVIESINGTSTVTYEGLPEFEVSIYLDVAQMEKYRLSLAEIRNAINAANVLSPIGSVNIDSQDYILSLDTKVKNISDLENIPVQTSSKNVVYLKDVANIEAGFAEQKVTSEIFFPGSEKNRRAVVFSVAKNDGYNILQLTDDVRAKLVELSAPGELLDGLEYKITLDLGKDARRDMVNLSKNGFASIFLVFVILIFVLGVKDAFVAAIGIPISFLLAFIFFNIVGNTLNFISLFSMILSIGILVDSDIVITEGIAKRKEDLKKKKLDISPAELEKKAAKQAVMELAGPMIAGTVTSIAVFAPLFFLSGVTGQFISGIPFTVVFILLASQIVSIFIVPLLHSSKFSFPFARFFIWIFAKLGWRKKQKPVKQTAHKKSRIKKFDFRKSKEKYNSLLYYFFAKKYRENLLVTAVILSFFASLMLPISGILKAEFFPGGDIPFIYGNIELDKGSTKADTRDYLNDLEALVKQETFFSSMITTSGQTSLYDQNGVRNGDRYANILLNLSDEESSNGADHLTSLREKITAAGLDKIEFSGAEGGPPTGAPIEMNVVSNDFTFSKEGAILAEKILDAIDGVINIKSELDKNNTGFEIAVDRSKAALLNVSLPAVATEILATTSGVEIFELKDKGESTKAYLKVKRSFGDRELEEISPELISNMKVKNNAGEYVYLSAFTQVLPKSVNANIKHLDGNVSIKITAEIEEGVILGDVISQIKSDFAEQNTSQSRLEFGGAFAEQEQSFAELGYAFGGGIALIFGVLIFLFNSLRLPMIVESVIPLAFSGVVVGLTLTGNLLSFPSILGFIALSGIVVNNSIILIYVYEEHRKKKVLEITGDPEILAMRLDPDVINDIVIEGSLSRLRPIILTTMTTIIGVVPLIFSSAIWAPIAYAIIFGLLFATVITLAFIPILYKKFYPKR